MKYNQSRPGIELVWPCLFSTTITITPRAPPFWNNKQNIYMFGGWIIHLFLRRFKYLSNFLATDRMWHKVNFKQLKSRLNLVFLLLDLLLSQHSRLQVVLQFIHCSWKRYIHAAPKGNTTNAAFDVRTRITFFDDNRYAKCASFFWGGNHIKYSIYVLSFWNNISPQFLILHITS